ncbi:major pollen allergen Bet v 1-L-like isoform X1 [Euphorbia lathyris]|uniref:major pollen allergen Bet v 1-L-like isoform X1 n=1 Tax=Euphorbia lathyris TaxID=212925 RepID=UPI003313558C
MAGVLTIHRDIITAVPVATMFKVFVLESDKFIPKIIPQITIEVLEGNGGPGTIKKTSFAAEGAEFKYIKTRIESTDTENLKHSYSVIGGEPWMETLDKVTHEFEMVSLDGETIVKCKSLYFAKDNSEVDEDIIMTAADKAMEVFKAIEAYILANPDV